MAAITESGSSAGRYGSAECKPLLEVATKELFRKNAFRITGLPVDATPRDLGKHAEKIKVLAELGQDPQPTAAFPLRPPPTLEDIRDAIQRLKDPEKRLIDEFFWFWPEGFGESRSDAAIQALQKGDLQTAADIWTSKRKHPTEGIVATHNLAVIFHIEAINWEDYSLRHEVDSKRRAEVTEYWKTAFYRWNRVLTNEQFWEKILIRVDQLNEPNLTSGFVRRMRETVPAALVKINAELALAFAEAGKSELARLHTDLMDGISEGAAHISKIAELVLTPARKRLREHIRNASECADKRPPEALIAARELLDHTRNTLSLFDLFITKNAHFRNDAYDEVAETCNRLQVTYHKATNDNKTCLEFLKVVLPFAASQELREQIEKNIQTLIENIAGVDRDRKFYGNLRPISSAPSLSTINGFGFTLYGSTDVDATNGSYLATYYFTALYIPIFPICRYRVIRDGKSYRFLGKAQLRTGDKWHLAIALGVVGLFVISVAISGNTQSPTSTGSSTYSSPYSSGAQRYAPPSSISTPSPGSSDDWDNMREQLRQRALTSEKDEIESERATVQALEDQVENLAREIERDRPYVDQTNGYEVDAFNAKLRRYGTLLQQAQSAEAAFNQKVGNYNAKLRGYTSPSPAQSPPPYRSNNTYRPPNSGSGNYASRDSDAGQVRSNATPAATRTVPDWALNPNASTAAPSPAPDTRPVGVVYISGNDTLNVRAGASADSAIVGTLRSGDHVYLNTERVVNAGKGVRVTWQKITSFSGYAGWVNADYISATAY